MVVLTIAGFLGEEDGFEIAEDGFETAGFETVELEVVGLEIVGLSESGVSSKACRMFKTDGISYDP